jgi:hypothetical protein
MSKVDFLVFSYFNMMSGNTIFTQFGVPIKYVTDKQNKPNNLKEMSSYLMVESKMCMTMIKGTSFSNYNEYYYTSV